MKTHSREKSNKCNQCDFASNQEGNLRIHLKSPTNATTVVFQQPRNETCRFTRRYNSEKLFKYKQCSYEGNQKISVYNDLWILCDCCDYKTSQKIFNAAYN